VAFLLIFKKLSKVVKLSHKRRELGQSGHPGLKRIKDKKPYFSNPVFCAGGQCILCAFRFSCDIVLWISPGLPDFLGTKYQNGEKYTKLPQTVPNI
jgi:hypothetical protein